jgi:hypothetical protein
MSVSFRNLGIDPPCIVNAQYRPMFRPAWSKQAQHVAICGKKFDETGHTKNSIVNRVMRTEQFYEPRNFWLEMELAAPDSASQFQRSRAPRAVAAGRVFCASQGDSLQTIP